MFDFRRGLLAVFLLIVVMSSCSYAAMDKNITVDFYYASDCPHCHKVINSGVLDRVNLIEGIHVNRYQIDAKENMDMFKEQVSNCGTQLGWPQVFIKDGQKTYVLVGDAPIIDNLEPTLAELILGNDINGTDNGKCVILGIGDFNVQRNTAKDLAIIIGTAAADSINPCIMSVLALLLSTLVTVHATRKMIKLGIIYAATVYLSYLIIGLLIVAGAYLAYDTLISNAQSISFWVKSIVTVLIVFCGPDKH